MKRQHCFMYITVLYLTLMFLSACGAAAAPAVSPTRTSAPTPTEMPPTATPLPTDTPVSPIPTATPTSTTTPTPTVTPTSTPLPDLQVIFDDDFSAACNLSRVNDERNTLDCENGEYTMLSKRASWWRWAYYRRTYGDVMIEADARVISGPGLIRYGLVWRVPATGDRYYAFLVTQSGEYMSFRYLQGDRFNLISLIRSDAVSKGTVGNHLKVVVQGEQMALYVNDRWLNTVSDSELSSGWIGFILWNDEPDAKVAFDNVRVMQINRPLDLPAPKPTPTNTPRAATPTRMPLPQPTPTPAPEFTLRTNFKAFERWGRPHASNCGLNDDTSPVMRLTWDVVVTNQSNKTITEDEWYVPLALTNTGVPVIRTCWYGAPQVAPGQTGTATLAEFVEMGQWVRRIVFRIRNSSYQVCLEADLRQVSC